VSASREIPFEHEAPAGARLYATGFGMRLVSIDRPGREPLTAGGLTELEALSRLRARLTKEQE